MKDLTDLLAGIDASIRSVDQAIQTATEVSPPGHRVEMTRSQLETAREVLARARGFAAAKTSGMIQAVNFKKP